jgi:hypothetical protein
MPVVSEVLGTLRQRLNALNGPEAKPVRVRGVWGSSMVQSAAGCRIAGVLIARCLWCLRCWEHSGSG